MSVQEQAVVHLEHREEPNLYIAASPNPLSHQAQVIWKNTDQHHFIQLSLFSYHNKDRTISLDEWQEIYKDKSWYEIATEAGWKQGQPLGPKKRYFLKPVDGNVMDMRPVTVVGYGYGENIGHLIEHIQDLHA